MCGRCAARWEPVVLDGSWRRHLRSPREDYPRCSVGWCAMQAGPELGGMGGRHARSAQFSSVQPSSVQFSSVQSTHAAVAPCASCVPDPPLSRKRRPPPSASSLRDVLGCHSPSGTPPAAGDNWLTCYASRPTFTGVVRRARTARSIPWGGRPHAIGCSRGALGRVAVG